MSSVGTIEYAPPPPWHRARRVRRLAIIVIGFFVVGVGLYNRQFLWHRSRLLYHQRQCATYVAPPDHVVLDSDPTRAADLAGRPGYLLAPASLILRDRLPTAGHTTAVHVPPCLREYQLAMNDNPGSRGDAVLFLHERTSSAGHRRIVVVRCSSMLDEHWIPYRLEWEVITPAGPTSLPSRHTGYTEPPRVERSRRIEHAPIRFFAGRHDAADPARFTIAYETRGQSFLLHGLLSEDGQTVRLSHTRP